MSRMLKKVGQSTLEYVIALTAIIAAILVGQSFLAQKSKTQGLGKMLENVGSKMNNATFSGLPGATDNYTVPTTSQPTTSQPTTSQPTTSQPTTSQPTTSSR